MASVQDECLPLSSVGLEGPHVGLEEPPVSPADSDETLPPAGYVKLPGQVSICAEAAIKLGRQASYDSVGSIGDDTQAEGDISDGSEGGSGGGLQPRDGRSSSVVSDASEEGGRDSGIEAERDPDMVIPDEDLVNRIVAQVEFYFSDANVSKDKFLLKHIRRNKEGYVSLKLVSSFKKIKQLTKDWRVVSYSLNKASAKIQINDQATKIRRVDPLPEITDTPVTQNVLVLGLQLEKPSVNAVSQIFGKCGEISLIRVLRAGATLATDMKALSAKYPALLSSHCAWIEFETSEAAKEACELSSPEGITVVPIVNESQKKHEKQTQPQKKKQQNNSRKNSCSSSISSSPPQSAQSSRKSSYASNSSRKNSSELNYPPRKAAPQRRKAMSLPQPHYPPIFEFAEAAESRRRPKSKSCTDCPPISSSPPTSWVQRHLLAAAAASAASTASPSISSRPPIRPGRTSQGSLSLPETVIRFPKGPDGSKGFSQEARKRVDHPKEGEASH